MSDSLRYKDIGEFGHSVHHLLSRLSSDVYHEQSVHSFGRNNGLHHAKREMKALDDLYPNDKMTDRDKKVIQLTIAVVQRLMATQHYRHNWGLLDRDEVFPVGSW